MAVCAVHTRCVSIGEIAVILRADGSAFNLFDISALANPLRAQGGQALLDVALKIGISPWTAGVVDAHWLVRLERAIERLGRSKSDFAKRDAQISVLFSCDVNLLGVRQLARRFFFSDAIVVGGCAGRPSAIFWVAVFLIHKKGHARKRMA